MRYESSPFRNSRPFYAGDWQSTLHPNTLQDEHRFAFYPVVRDTAKEGKEGRIQ